MTFPEFNLPAEMPRRYNIAPSQPVPVVANNRNGEVDFFHWGLIPSWAKDPSIGHKLINARAESLAEKPSFKNALRRRRCLILADGFYEWYRAPEARTKTPVRIQMKSGRAFAFAGLWEYWQHPEGASVLSCTIITTEPNTLMAQIHNRMPVILPPEDYALWLDPKERPAEALQDLLRPYEPEEMTAYPVSPLVNNPSNDVPACIEPAGAADFLR
jgi:putative SOS response-associated peptidase YedK